jgi:hypothetical protein
VSRETRFAKAERLVRDGRVEVLEVTDEEQWSCLVDGDTDTYLVGRTPERRYCECTYGADRGCSHYIAADAAVVPIIQSTERSNA